jgi:hypothetical protein
MEKVHSSRKRRCVMRTALRLGTVLFALAAIGSGIVVLSDPEEPVEPQCLPGVCGPDIDPFLIYACRHCQEWTFIDGQLHYLSGCTPSGHCQYLPFNPPPPGE